MKWNVLIRRFSDAEISKAFGPYASHRAAERVANGININLDHERFYTEMRFAEQNATGTATSEHGSEQMTLGKTEGH
jgi:hypothetical protein